MTMIFSLVAYIVVVSHKWKIKVVDSKSIEMMIADKEHVSKEFAEEVK